MDMQPSQKWQAIEGDTILYNNLPEWSPTVCPTVARRHKSRSDMYRRRLRESQSKTGRMFYLRYGDQSQYLTVYRSEWIPRMIKAELGVKPGLGFKPDPITMISLFVRDCIKFGCCFDFQTPEGVPVTKIEYEI